MDLIGHRFLIGFALFPVVKTRRFANPGALVVAEDTKH